MESEAAETPDKSKAYVGLGKRRNADLDSAEPQEKKSRHDPSDYSAESTRGRSNFRNIGRRLFGRSQSRATTPDTKHTPGSAKKGADKNSEDVFSHLGFRKPAGAAALTPPGSIAPSTSTTSTGTSNNADDEASAFGDDDGVKSSPAGVSGTPKISITKVYDEKDYLFVNVDSASAVLDSAESGREDGSKWPPLKARSVSRERPSRLKLGEEPVSPTPVSATHRKSRSPFSALRRPVPIHGATAPNPSHSRALSPPPSTPRRVTSPVLQATGQSRKRKQAEPDLGQGLIIPTWYDGERHPKKNRT